jgi:hypothetical protein
VFDGLARSEVVAGVVGPYIVFEVMPVRAPFSLAFSWWIFQTWGLTIGFRMFSMGLVPERAYSMGIAFKCAVGPATSACFALETG